MAVSSLQWMLLPQGANLGVGSVFPNGWKGYIHTVLKKWTQHPINLHEQKGRYYNELLSFRSNNAKNGNAIVTKTLLEQN